MDEFGRHGSGGTLHEKVAEFAKISLGGKLNGRDWDVRRVRLVYCYSNLVDFLYSLCDTSVRKKKITFDLDTLKF